MLKWAGILLIVAGTGGFGRYLGNCLKLHLDQLVECREIFAQMDAERDYLKLPYAQLLKRTARGKTDVFCCILTKVAKETEKNKEADVSALWEAAFKENKKRLFLKEEERSILLSLAKILTLEGNYAQVAKIYFMQLEERIGREMEERKEKQKVYGAVSILFGLFLVILLL